VRAPVLLVHGWGSSFERTWVATGVSALLEDAGRTVIGVDLLGHGAAPKPHDPEAYRDLTGRLVEALPPAGPADAVGFSLGAITLLELACRQPELFDRLVLAGIGANVFERDAEGTRRIVAGIRGLAPETDVQAHAFRHYAEQPGNDPEALVAVLERATEPITEERLTAITCPVLVALGDRDFAGPADRLVAALPDARLATLRNTDHFATPESFAFIDAMLGFLDALPS
jgi:pimeloyl-ACP methyl ester carboxylesterase